MHTIIHDNNLLILDVNQLNKIMKLNYFYTLKALWDGQGKINVYYGMFRVKKQLTGKKSIITLKTEKSILPVCDVKNSNRAFRR